MEPNQNIMLRVATLADCDWVLEWRNHKVIREHFFDEGVVEKTQHRQWFESAIGDKDKIMLVAESAGGPVAFLRYDLLGEKAEVSVYVQPEKFSKGIGTQVLALGSAWLSEYIPAITELVAKVKNSNVRSCKAFEKAGYKKDYIVLTHCLK